MPANDYGFPVYRTQGGGLAKQVGDYFVFVEAPENIPSLQVGDQVPDEWGIIPANDEARIHEEKRENEEMCREQAEEMADYFADYN